MLAHHLAASRAVCAVLPRALAYELASHPTVVADGNRLAWRYGDWIAGQARAAGLPVLDARPYDTAVDRVAVVVGARA